MSNEKEPTVENYADKIIEICHHNFPLVPPKDLIKKGVTLLINEFYNRNEGTFKDLHYTETTRADILQDKLTEVCQQIEKSNEALSHSTKQLELSQKIISVSNSEISTLSLNCELKDNLNDMVCKSNKSRFDAIKLAIKRIEKYPVKFVNIHPVIKILKQALKD